MPELIIIPILIAFITQIVKLSIDGIPKNLNWQHIVNNYGGMPSSHTAFVSSLATLVALVDGINSTTFAISVVLMIVVVRDAIGFRREIGKHALLANTLAEEVFEAKAEPLNEQIGHSLAEAAVGFVVGIILAFVLHFAWLAMM